MTTDLHDQAVARLEQLLAGARIRCRGSSTGGEYDWLRSLDEGERRVFIMERTTARVTAPTPDVCATLAGYDDVDDWATDVVDTWRTSRRLSVVDEYDRRPDDTDTPVGLLEISQRLRVKRATVQKWRTRGVLPLPEMIVSGQPAWWWSTIDDWYRQRESA